MMRCLLCHGAIRNLTRYENHLKEEHEVTHALDMVMAVTFLNQGEGDYLKKAVKERKDRFEKEGIYTRDGNIFGQESTKNVKNDARLQDLVDIREYILNQTTSKEIENNEEDKTNEVHSSVKSHPNNDRALVPYQQGANKKKKEVNVENNSDFLQQMQNKILNDLDDNSDDEEENIPEKHDNGENKLKIKEESPVSENEDTDLECKLCFTHFNSKTYFDRHMNGVHKKDLHLLERNGRHIQYFPCLCCAKTLLSDGLLKIHMRQHTGFDHKCVKCGKMFAGKRRTDDLANHVMVCGTNHETMVVVKKEKIEDNGTPEENKKDDSNNEKTVNDFAVVPIDLMQNFSQKMEVDEDSTVLSKIVDDDLEQPPDDEAEADQIMCRLCYSGFARKRALKKHEQTIHKDDQKELNLEDFGVDDLVVPCDICNMKFLSENIMTNHRRIKHRQIILHGQISKGESDDNLIIERCEDCPSMFSTHSALRKHNVAKHKKIIPRDQSKFKFSCRLCYRFFEYSRQVKNHETKVHRKDDFEALNNLTSNEQLTHSCKECENKFLTEALVRYHVRTYHVGKVHNSLIENGYLRKCNDCPKAFRSTSSLRRHLKKIHNKKLAIADLAKNKFKRCVDCSKRFLSSRSLSRHSLKVHKKPVLKMKDKSHYSIKCELCYKLFEYASGMRKHKIKVHSKKDIEALGQPITEDQLKFPCDKCENKFLSKDILSFHMRTHREFVDTGDDSTKCSLCRVNLYASEKLEAHKNLFHASEMDAFETKDGEDSLNFSCNSCNGSFKTQNSVIYHSMKMHRSKETHCKLCRLNFKNSGGFTQHKMRIHMSELHAFDIKYEESSMHFSCDTCDRKYPTEASVNHHKNLQHYNRKNRIPNPLSSAPLQIKHIENKQCNLCRVNFTRTKALESHKKVFHEGEMDAFEAQQGNLLTFPCNSCGEFFMTKKSVVYHNKFVHKTKETYCRLCRLNFKNSNGFFSHKTKIHMNEFHAFDIKFEEADLQYKCNNCNKKYPTETSLNHHMNLRHKTKTKNANANATMPVKSNTNLDRHCQLCNVIYKKPEYLRRHKFKIHYYELDAFNREIKAEELTHECNICSVKFFSENSLIFHKTRVHSARKEEGSGFCKLCQTTVARLYKHTYQAHKSAEEKTALEDYSDHLPMESHCRFCNKYLLNSKVLAYHIRYNHREEARQEEWKCELCEKIFPAGKNRSSNYQNHIRNIHNSDGSTRKKSRPSDNETTMKNYLNLLNSLQK